MYIGLDIGGTNIRYGLSWDLKKPAQYVFCNRFVQTGNVYTDIEENICKLIDKHIDVEGIGISLAANIDRSSGVVNSWSNNPGWNGYNFIEHIKQRYDLPILVEDDANCGAWGEYVGFYNQFENMIYITIGTGVGCGMVIGKKLFIGETGTSGELGHVIFNESADQLCSCGQNGCLQSLVSGKAIVEHYVMSTSSKDNIKSAYELIERFNNGDKDATHTINYVKDKLTYTIYNLIMLLDISVFVIGGGVGMLYKDFLLEIENSANDMLRRFGKKASIFVAQYNQYSGVQGVLNLLGKYIEEKKK